MIRRGIAAAIALMITSPSSQAATLTCTFTEPFLTVTFTSADGKLVVVSPNDNDPATGKPMPQTMVEGAKLVRDGEFEKAWQFRVSKDDTTYLVVRQRTGSDGMSETIYPFEGIYLGFYGGCETEMARSYDEYEVWNAFGVEP